MKGILGKKIGMTQLFLDNGNLVPVTIVESKPNIVLQVKNIKSHGYISTQLCFEDKKEKKISKPKKGQFLKSNIKFKNFIKEIRNMSGFNIGEEIKINIFSEGEFVDVTSISKGKGFSGVIKRHNFSRGPMSHGSGFHRSIGSMGAIAPNRIFKLKKMPGHLGRTKTTIQNLQIISIDLLNNILIIKGSVPGPNKQLLVIKKSIKKTKLINFNKIFIRKEYEKQI